MREKFTDEERATFKLPEWGPEVPDGWRELDSLTFAKTCPGRIYAPYASEYRQMQWNGEHIYTHLYSMWDRTGYAIYFDYHKGMRFFLFGCDHTYKHVSRDGNCLNSYVCTQCGQKKQVDSSD